MPLPLFSMPVPKDPNALATTAQNVGQPLIAARAGRGRTDQFYGSDKSVFIQGVAPAALSICNLSDAGGGAWAHSPAAGHVAIDPELGRIAYGTAPAAPPLVSYHYGFSADLGGGSYDRLASFQNLQPVLRVPSPQATVQAALDSSAGGGAVEITDSGHYAETIAIHPTATGAVVELRAADQMVPFIALGGDLLVSGADGAEVSLNGLWIAGGRVRIAAGDINKLSRLTLRHCTLTPGISRARRRQPGAARRAVAGHRNRGYAGDRELHSRRHQDRARRECHDHQQHRRCDALRRGRLCRTRRQRAPAHRCRSRAAP